MPAAAHGCNRNSFPCCSSSSNSSRFAMLAALLLRLGLVQTPRGASVLLFVVLVVGCRFSVWPTLMKQSQGKTRCCCLGGFESACNQLVLVWDVSWGDCSTGGWQVILRCQVSLLRVTHLLR